MVVRGENRRRVSKRNKTSRTRKSSRRRVSKKQKTSRIRRSLRKHRSSRKNRQSGGSPSSESEPIQKPYLIEYAEMDQATRSAIWKAVISSDRFIFPSLSEDQEKQIMGKGVTEKELNEMYDKIRIMPVEREGSRVHYLFFEGKLVKEDGSGYVHITSDEFPLLRKYIDFVMDYDLGLIG